jgi:DNA-binding GntR family transcriptional regulator
MMMNQKKMAMMIIKNAMGKDPASDNSSFVDRGGNKKPDIEVEMELSSKDGMIASMDKLIKAIHAKDSEKAVEAMSEYLDACEVQMGEPGVESVENEVSKEV